MSTISPRSLLYSTVDFIAKNYSQLCEIRRDVKVGDDLVLLRFKNDYWLPSNICELLLQRFFFHHDINSPLDFLTLFTDPDRFPLKKFSTGNACHKLSLRSNFSLIMEMILRCQNLVELDDGTFINHILFSTDFSTSRSAISLKKMTLCWNLPAFPGIPAPQLTHNCFIRNFSNLKHLSLKNFGNIANSDVGTLASEMKHLECLDLSSTSVSVTDVFDKLTTKLKILILHDTPLVYGDLTGLLEFSNLYHLDISQKLDVTHNINAEMSKFFTSEKSLPFLTSLDVSGSGTLESAALQIFLQKHNKLYFLGLLDVHYQLENTVLENIEVTGKQSLPQVLACLNHYRNRPSYLTKALKTLYNLSCADHLKEDVELRRKIIELVLDLMQKHMSTDEEDLQTAASACLHNYIRYDTENEPKALHISILSDLVTVVIQVLRVFPNAEQIQRNSLIVLYNRYILSAAKFNAHLLSDLFFKAIILLPEGNVTGIALDMCAYLSSRISVEETLKLGTTQNIEKLLSVISAQVERATVGILLLCSLRVLWNLTDEAPQTCHLVINNNGLLLMLRALQAFDEKSDVLTKLLGVMNNLAEVLDIRPVLMCDELVSLLQKYLDANYSIDVCYFAAGTLCNLLLSWPDELTLDCGEKCDLLFSVGSAVNRWKKTVKVMVGYRTFKSFLPLLQSSHPDVQLWAIWAIDHVCSHKVERYSQLCSEEGVVDVLRLRTTSDNREDVKDLAEQALEAILKN